jgi:hypothetical protein
LSAEDNLLIDRYRRCADQASKLLPQSVAALRLAVKGSSLLARALCSDLRLYVDGRDTITELASIVPATKAPLLSLPLYLKLAT